MPGKHERTNCAVGRTVTGHSRLACALTGLPQLSWPTAIAVNATEQTSEPTRWSMSTQIDCPISSRATGGIQRLGSGATVNAIFVIGEFPVFVMRSFERRYEPGPAFVSGQSAASENPGAPTTGADTKLVV